MQRNTLLQDGIRNALWECSVYQWIPACAGMTCWSGNDIPFLKMLPNNLIPYHRLMNHPKSQHTSAHSRYPSRTV